MDRRKEPRFDSRAPARIRSLCSDEAADGLLLNISGRGARVVVRQEFPVNTPVRIDVGEKLLLGDICYCRPEPDGNFSIGVALSHSILEMTALGHLMDRLVVHPIQPGVETPAPPAPFVPPSASKPK